MKIKLLLFIIGSFLFSCKNTQDKKQNADKNPIEISMDRNADSLLLDPTTNGISIGVYKDGKSYIRHYGELDKGKGNKPTDETIYEIASVSKTFAGTLVAQAEFEGKLNLEDDIRKYLDGDYPNLEYDGNPIRIKHLITHTSGLPKFLPLEINTLFEKPDDSLAFKISAIENNYSKKRFLQDLESIVIDTIPGTINEYSNADTVHIAHILENIYEMNYNDLIQSKICNKFGMAQTGTVLNAYQKEHLANGYTNNHSLAPHMSSTLWSAGGGMTSTMPDMMKYIKFQLDGENELALKSHEVLYENDGQKVGYYWPIEFDDKNGTYLFHHGGAFGIQNLLFIIPKGT